MRREIKSHDKANLSCVIGARQNPFGGAQKSHILRNMANKPSKITHIQQALDPGLTSLFDPDPRDPADLWFLPQRGDTGLDALASPLPRADARKVFDLADWRQAQADLGGALAALCLRYGALEERLANSPQGLLHRLALREAADFSWWAGHPVGAERLALWMGDHLGAGDDAQGLTQAAWAARRLSAGRHEPGHDLAQGGWHAGIAALLGHTPNDAIADVAELMAQADALHPVTQAAILFQAWQILGQGPACQIEAVVLAACHAASMGQRGGGFLPLASGGVGGLQAAGSPRARLSAWISGAQSAVLAALHQIERLRLWHDKARMALHALGGRTPRELVDLFAAWPMISAPMAQAHTQASRAAVQRNLDKLAALGLICERTGQRRYRVWAAKL